jgi:hypothetical protein
MSGRSSYTPFRFVVFLDYCAKLILLKKVGGGFIHRMQLEYFAELESPRNQRESQANHRTAGQIRN